MAEEGPGTRSFATVASQRDAERTADLMNVPMVALTASFVVPRPGVASAASFGGVIQLSRMLLRADRSKPVVCVACRTINRASTLVCKGCDGKLPAFYTAERGDSGAAAPDAAPLARGRALLAPLRGPWATVLGVGLVLVVLYAAFALWYAAYAAAARPPVPALQLSAGPAAPAAMPSPARTADALNITLSSGTPDDAAAVEAPPRPAQLRRSAQAPAATHASPSTFRRAGPLAMCSSLNVFARAICMNNSCAQRATAHHPQCAKVLRQRRLDEARRNPTLFN